MNSDKEQEKLRQRLKEFKEKKILSSIKNKENLKNSNEIKVQKPTTQAKVTKIGTKERSKAFGKSQSNLQKMDLNPSKNKQKTTLKPETKRTETPTAKGTTEHPTKNPTEALIKEIPTLTDKKSTFDLLKYYSIPMLQFNKRLINVPKILLFTLNDAVAIAEQGNKILARWMFSNLMHSNGLAFDGKRYKPQNYQKSFEFYSIWLHYEEQWEDYIKLCDVYNDATDHLVQFDDLWKLRSQYQKHISNIGGTNVNVVDEEDQSILKRIDDVIEHQVQINNPFYCIEEVVDDFESMNIFSEKENEQVESISIKPCDLENKEENTPINTPKKPTRKIVGVPMNEAGSTYTLLTPVKATPKLKKELKVNSVVTPVRRSTRFQQDYEFRLAHQETVTFGKESEIKELLKEHEFAYMPNKVNISNKNVDFKLPAMVKKKKDD